MAIVDDFFQYLGILLLFINTCLYIWSYRTHSTVALKYFSIYLLIIFIVQATGHVYAFYKKDNLFLSHYYFISQFVLLSLFYKSLFKKNQKSIVNVTLILVLTILAIQYFNNPKMFFRFNILEIFVTTFPIIVFSIMYLYNSLSIPGKFMNINAGILVYLTTSSLIYILGDYITTYIKSVPTIRNDAIVNIWFLNKVLYVGFLLLILIEWKKNILPAKKK